MRSLYAISLTSLLFGTFAAPQATADENCVFQDMKNEDKFIILAPAFDANWKFCIVREEDNKDQGALRFVVSDVHNDDFRRFTVIVKENTAQPDAIACGVYGIKQGEKVMVEKVAGNPDTRLAKVCRFPD